MHGEMQRLVDRSDILKLMARANRFLDDQNLDAYVECYTPDGIFHTVGLEPARGRNAIKDLMNNSAGPLHFTLDTVVTIENDQAKSESNLFVAWGTPDCHDNGFLVTARYRDSFVRTTEGWKFTYRHVSTDMKPEAVFARLQAEAGPIDRGEWLKSVATRWEAA